MKRTIRGARTKGSFGAKITNNTKIFGIMGGLAPQRNASVSTLRGFREGHAKLQQKIPADPVKGLAYMMGQNPMGRYMLSKNPVGSGGVGNMIPNIPCCSAGTLVNLPKKDAITEEIAPMVPVDPVEAMVAALPLEGQKLWNDLDPNTQSEWSDAIRAADPITGDHSIFFPENIKVYINLDISFKTLEKVQGSGDCTEGGAAFYYKHEQVSDKTTLIFQNRRWVLKNGVNDIIVADSFQHLFGCNPLNFIGLHIWRRHDHSAIPLILVLILPYNKGKWITNNSHFSKDTAAGKCHVKFCGVSSFQLSETDPYNFKIAKNNIPLNTGQHTPYPCTSNGYPDGMAVAVAYKYLQSSYTAFDHDGNAVLKTVGHQLNGTGPTLKTCCEDADKSKCTKGLCYQIQAMESADASPHYPGGAIILGIGGISVKQGGSVEMGYTEKNTVFPGRSPQDRVPVKYRLVDCETLVPY